MNCPFCGKEMKEGRIPSRDRLKWRDDDAQGMWGEGIPLSGWLEEVQAFYCPRCRQIVLPVPETEGVLDMVERKLSAAGDKIETAREQWEARRAQAKDQKEKEKFGQKNPWEL